jgi:uncharacterized protein (UPF0333 family)
MTNKLLIGAIITAVLIAVYVTLKKRKEKAAIDAISPSQKMMNAKREALKNNAKFHSPENSGAIMYQAAPRTAMTLYHEPIK